MDNIKENKRINYIYQDKKYTREGINNINHTNINNNINITNYYPSSSQNYCSKQTFTFIDENGSVQNAISYPIKTATHKTKRIKESSPTPNPYDKKYHQCQSPYMKKILPISKRQKSEEGNRIINIYKNSPSTKFIKNNRKKSLKNHNFYNSNNNTNSMRKIENQNNFNINNNKQINIGKNYYLDLSSDDINNKYKSNRIYNNNSTSNYLNNEYKNKEEINKIKYKNYKTLNKPIMTNNQLMTSYESNGNESHINILDKPYQISMANKQPIYKIASFDKNNFISYNNFNSPKLVKSQKNININYKKSISIEKKISKYIILIQSVIRGYLLRIKLAQYLNLYERIKKAVSFIQYIIFKRKKYILYYIIKNNINKKLFNYYNNNSYLIPVNNIFFEIKKINIRHTKTTSNENNNKKLFAIKNIETSVSEIQKELNKKKIDYAVAEKRIKELLLENKKIQNINKIIVRDNKQLALKLKNSQNNKSNILKAQNTNFYILNISNKNEIKTKIYNLLRKIIIKKEIKTKALLYKYFYKFNLQTKLLYIKQITEKENNNKKNLIIENNNFIINQKNEINNNDDNKEINIDKRIKKLNIIIKKKDFNLYLYRNIFEKWMMRALIFKNKEFIKEKKKKKKEKFKQRKQKKLYGNIVDKNSKKNDEENENENSGDSDDFDIEQKYSNKSGSSKKNNYYDENNEK